MHFSELVVVQCMSLQSCRTSNLLVAVFAFYCKYISYEILCFSRLWNIAYKYILLYNVFCTVRLLKHDWCWNAGLVSWINSDKGYFWAKYVTLVFYSLNFSAIEHWFKYQNRLKTVRFHCRSCYFSFKLTFLSIWSVLMHRKNDCYGRC